MTRVSAQIHQQVGGSSGVELELLGCRELRLRQSSVTVQLTEASREEGEYLLLNLGLLLKL